MGIGDLPESERDPRGSFPEHVTECLIVGHGDARALDDTDSLEPCSGHSLGQSVTDTDPDRASGHAAPG